MKTAVKFTRVDVLPARERTLCRARLREWLPRVACAFLAGVASSAMAQILPPPSSQVTEYSLPNPAVGSCEIEFDHSGVAWIEEITGGAISSFNPATGVFQRFPLAQPGAVPGGIEIGPDNGVWFPQLAANLITRLEPADGSMQSYPIPQLPLVLGSITTGAAVASDMAAGPDGGMWFSMSGTNAVGRIDIATRQIEIIPISGPLATASVITQIIQPGPGNLLVISLGAANKIATINAFTRQVTEYTVPTPAALPQGVTTDRNGIIWFTETAAHKFGRLDVATGEIVEYDILQLRTQLPLSLGNPLPFPGPIRQGSDGKIYFAQGGFEAGNKIGQFDPSTNTYKEFVVPSPLAGICDVNNSQNGYIWFGEFTGNKIGKLRIQ